MKEEKESIQFNLPGGKLIAQEGGTKLFKYGNGVFSILNLESPDIDLSTMAGALSVVMSSEENINKIIPLKENQYIILTTNRAK